MSYLSLWNHQPESEAHYISLSSPILSMETESNKKPHHFRNTKHLLGHECGRSVAQGTPGNHQIHRAPKGEPQLLHGAEIGPEEVRKLSQRTAQVIRVDPTEPGSSWGKGAKWPWPGWSYTMESRCRVPMFMISNQCVFRGIPKILVNGDGHVSWNHREKMESEVGYLEWRWNK